MRALLERIKALGYIYVLTACALILTLHHDSHTAEQTIFQISAPQEPESKKKLDYSVWQEESKKKLDYCVWNAPSLQSNVPGHQCTIHMNSMPFSARAICCQDRCHRERRHWVGWSHAKTEDLPVGSTLSRACSVEGKGPCTVQAKVNCGIWVKTDQTGHLHMCTHMYIACTRRASSVTFVKRLGMYDIWLVRSYCMGFNIGLCQKQWHKNCKPSFNHHLEAPASIKSKPWWLRC